MKNNLFFFVCCIFALLSSGKPDPVNQKVPNPPAGDFAILDRFGSDSPHAQMLVCEHARTLADFGPAPSGHKRNGSIVGSNRSYVDPHGGEYITTYVGKEYAGQTYLIDNKPYVVCEHGYIVDPIYEKGGYLFTPMYRDEINLYMIAMDFNDLRGDNFAPYGVQRSVLINNGAVYDLTYPQVIFNMTYHGNKGLTALPNHIFKGSGTVTDGAGVGIVDRLQMMSIGRMKVNAICLNEEYAKLHPEMDEKNDKWPWFRAESAMMSYNTQGPAECEDYRQFSRIHQGGIDAAMMALEKLHTDVLAGRWTIAQIQTGTGYQNAIALAAAIQKVMDDFENVDSIYTAMPPTTHGYGYGWQAGSGIASAFGYNDQSQVLRDSEYRHIPGARTPGGRMLGGGVFGTMNLMRDFSRVITTWMHEFGHTFGFIDDYSYANLGDNNGEFISAGSANTAWSLMGNNDAMRSGTDIPAWRKFRLGWLAEEEVLMLLPGEKKRVAILALGAQGDPGAYDDALAGELAKLGYASGEVENVGVRLVAIPKEYRTRETFGVVWDNGWNLNKTAYNWYDWFINVFPGGETYAIKSFPTFYTLESRKPIGVDKYMDELRIQYRPAAGTVMGSEGGVVVGYIANSTWESGHGAGGFKGVSGDIPLRKGEKSTWEDQNIGLSIKVLETGTFFDVVEIEYASEPQCNAARHVYLGGLTASDNFVERNDTFAVTFDIFTFGGPNTNDTITAPRAPTRVATPLGVPGGIAGYTMKVEFDAKQFDFLSADNTPFSYTVDKSHAANGVLMITAVGNKMIDKDIILNLNFKAKSNALLGDYTVKGVITDVVLHNWRGKVMKVGDPGFNGTINGSSVGTIGNGTFADFHTPNTLNLSSEDIKSSGGKVRIGANPTYTVSGRVVCEVPGPLYGLMKQSDGIINNDNFTGVESIVTLYQSGISQAIASTKSDYKGYFTFDGIPDGIYTVTSKKPKYDLGASPEFRVSGTNVIIGSDKEGVKGKIAIPPLKRERYTISGVVKGSPHSDGSSATPLAEVDVYLVNIGAAYEIMGGPVKSDSQGRFTVAGLESFHPYAAVAVSVKGTPYEDKYLPQIHLYPYMNKPFFGITEKLELNLGLNWGESGQDYRYPEGDVQLNAYGGSRRYYLNPGGAYNVKLTENINDRNITLVETQDIRLRIQTKSNEITYQLRDMDGKPVGTKVKSLGNTNGDDIIRNVAPGEYYIEASRPGYIGGCTMPFLVHGTRIILRQNQSNNTMELLPVSSSNTVTGKVVDHQTGESIEGASIVFIPYNSSFGKGIPIRTGKDGAFIYPVVTGVKDITVNHPDFEPKTIHLSDGGADLGKIELMPKHDYSPWKVPIRPTDADIARRMVVDDPHHGEFCSEDAATVREFGPGTQYGPIMTNGVVDPLFEKGGFLFGPTDKAKMKIYAIAVDFPDAIGDLQITHGRHRNVVKVSNYGGTVFDFSDPLIHFDYVFGGSDALKKNRNFNWLGSISTEFKGIERILEEQSMGRLDVEVELLNERYAQATDWYDYNKRSPWFRLDEPIFGYSTAGPADCEDYAQFTRLFQAAINVANNKLREAGLDDSVVGEGANFEDIGFIYVITPFNAFGYRLGFQGGGGIMAAYSVNEQILTLRDSEYRHAPGVLTPGGRMVGSGSYGMKGPFNMSSANPLTTALCIQLHELSHGLGFFDDYAYGFTGDANDKYFVSNIGESPHSGVNRWGIMDMYNDMRTATPDPPVWRKFRMGWIYDDEIAVLLPQSEPQTIYLRASGSYAGDGGIYTDDPSIRTRMILIPKEHRTRDTYGMVWSNLWNPHGTNYDWYEWFVNLFVGGETYSVKSFPTFYTLESRKSLGADGKSLGHYTGLPTEKDGVVVGYVANPTWETGHGGGGFKVMSGDFGLNANPNRTHSWVDPHIGLTVTVKESTAFYDKVEVTYTGVATTEARHVYQGILKASDHYVAPANEFCVDFDIVTLGSPAIDDHGLTTERSVQSGGLRGTTAQTTFDPAPPLPTEVKRVATPLGVPGGISGFTMNVEFDANQFDYLSAGTTPFACTVDRAHADNGVLVVTAVGDEMIDKDVILSLNFKTKTNAQIGKHTVKGTITDVTLLNWRGNVVKRGDRGFDDVGTFGNGTLAALYNTIADHHYTPGIRSIGGTITVSTAATYIVSGQITCDTPGPGGAGGNWIGVESTVTLYNGGNVAIATTKSDWNGYYTIKGIPVGTGYYIAADKPKYDRGVSAAFRVVDSNVKVAELTLKRTRYPVSGTVWGAVNSDGNDKKPLSGVEVYLLSIGNGYRVLGGPAITDERGRYTVYATTDSETKAFAGLAVKVAGNAAKYGTQLTIFAKNDLSGKQSEDIRLNMGTQPHLISDDWVYPTNNERLGQFGTFAFHLGGPNSQIVTNRDILLTETQDVHIRTATKSADIFYQLRKWPSGEAVGEKVRSVGTNNGDDLIRNVSQGQYSIEVNREGYVPVNTMPFTVFTTRLLLRDGQTSNTLDINTLLGTNVVSGKVVDRTTGLPIRGANIVFQSWSVTGGMGNPIKSAADGTFKYDVLPDDKDIIFSAEGYQTKTVNIVQGGAANLLVELEKASIPIEAYFDGKWRLYRPDESLEIGVEVGGQVTLRAFYFTAEHNMYSIDVYGNDHGHGGFYTPPTGDIAAYNDQGELTGVLATGNRIDFQWYTSKTATNHPTEAAKVVYDHQDTAKGHVISNILDPNTSAAFLGTHYYFAELTHTDSLKGVKKYYSAPVKIEVKPFTSYPIEFMTPAEASGWRLTATSDEVVDYFEVVVQNSGGRMKMNRAAWQTLGRADGPQNATNPNAHLHRPSPPRDIPIVIISDPNRPVAGPADVGNRVVVLISAGPHSGEVEGKEAAMIFAREAAVGKWDKLLEDVVIVLLPTGNREGNDLLLAQRINGQYLPKFVGSRPTAGVVNPLAGVNYNPTNEMDNWYNINRDMCKLDTPEARVLTDIMNHWDPVLFIDLHATNGTLMLHAVTWNAGLHPDTDSVLLDYNRYAFGDLAMGKESYLYKKQGKTVRLYGVGYVNTGNRYWSSDNYEPRYTTNYVNLRNRLSNLVEVYSHDPYPVRVGTAYGSIVGSLLAVQIDKAKIGKLIAETDAWAIGRAERGIDPNNPRDNVTLSAILPTMEGSEFAADPTLIKEMEVEVYRTNDVNGIILNQAIRDPSVVSLGSNAVGDRVGTLFAGLPSTTYKANDRRHYVPLDDSGMPGKVVMGAYYLLDKDCKGAIEALQLHGIKFDRLTKEITIAANDFQWFNASIRRKPTDFYEGRLKANRASNWVGAWTNANTPQVIPAGTYVVSTAQPLGNLAAILLEPGCVDGLLSWTHSDAVKNPIQINFFDDCLDKKEETIRYHHKSDSGEDYVPIFKVTNYTSIQTSLQ